MCENGGKSKAVVHCSMSVIGQSEFFLNHNYLSLVNLKVSDVTIQKYLLSSHPGISYSQTKGICRPTTKVSVMPPPRYLSFLESLVAFLLGGHHTYKLFIIDLSIPVHVSLSDHLVHLLIRQFLTQVGHHVT